MHSNSSFSIPILELPNAAKQARYHYPVVSGRRCTVALVGDYEVYALENIHRPSDAHSFSARLIAPADDITPYRWIKAWITTETWAEALIAADQLAERVREGLPLGEHECIRRAAARAGA